MSDKRRSVSAEDVRHVAKLARLELADSAVDSLVRDLGSILGHMEVLGEVDRKGVPEASGMGASGMRLRADTREPGELAEPPSAFAPGMRDGFFVVPRLASHDDGEQRS